MCNKLSNKIPLNDMLIFSPQFWKHIKLISIHIKQKPFTSKLCPLMTRNMGHGKKLTTNLTTVKNRRKKTQKVVKMSVDDGIW